MEKLGARRGAPQKGGRSPQIFKRQHDYNNNNVVSSYWSHAFLIMQNFSGGAGAPCPPPLDPPLRSTGVSKCGKLTALIIIHTCIRRKEKEKINYDGWIIIVVVVWCNNFTKYWFILFEIRINDKLKWMMFDDWRFINIYNTDGHNMWKVQGFDDEKLPGAVCRWT